MPDKLSSESQTYVAKVRQQFATVDEMIKTLQSLSLQGKGDYVVGCNDEYWLAKKSDNGEVDDARRTVEFGGYADVN